MEKNKKKGSRNPSTSADMSRRKRVKFADDVNNVERTQSPVGDVKTSEYKSFMRLLGKVDCQRRSCQQSEHADGLKQLKESDNTEERNIHESNRTVLHPPKVPTIPLMTPKAPATTSQDCELHRTKFGGSSLIPVENVTPIVRMSLLSPGVLDSGPESKHGGYFQEKRKHLLLLAAEASSQKVDEILLNKSDVITEFLQRLRTRTKSSNVEVPLKSDQKVTTSSYRSLVPFESHDDTKTLKLAWSESLGRELVGYSCTGADKSTSWQLDKIDDQESSSWGARNYHSQYQQCQPNLLSWQLDKIEDQESPSWGARNYHSQYQRSQSNFISWQPDKIDDRESPSRGTCNHHYRNQQLQSNIVFRAKGHSDILAEYRSPSSPELDKFGGANTVFHTSGSRELITLPWEYVKVQAPPCMDIADNFFEGKAQHSNAFDNVQPRDVVQAIPPSWSLDSYEGAAGNLLVPKEHSIISSMFPKANEHTPLSRNKEVSVRSLIWDSSPVLGLMDFAETGNMKPEYEGSGLAGGHLTENSIVPYNYSLSAYSYEPCSPNFKSELENVPCMLPLIQWSNSVEPEAPTLYTASDPSYDFETDVSCCLGIEWKRPQIGFNQETCSSINTDLFCDREREDGVGLIATENIYGGFLQMGVELSLNREKDIFGAMSEKLCWQ